MQAQNRKGQAANATRPFRNRRGIGILPMGPNPDWQCHGREARATTVYLW
jgi:hypothetical protein